jgi:hypothetical protein
MQYNLIRDESIQDLDEASYLELRNFIDKFTRSLKESTKYIVLWTFSNREMKIIPCVQYWYEPEIHMLYIVNINGEVMTFKIINFNYVNTSYKRSLYEM